MKNHLSYLDRPVFITGFGKSGTTLFLSLLDGHPQLVVFPEELHFFREVLYEREKAKAIREDTGFRAFLSNEVVQGWSQGKDWFRDGYPEFDCRKFNLLVKDALEVHKSSKDLLLLLVKAFAEVDNIGPAGKSHWVSKTPHEEIFFPVMRKMFGKGCKLVYIVRDPRDVYTSLSKRKEIARRQTIQDLRGLISFCVCWQTKVRRVMCYQKKHQNVGIFRYEDLLLTTENTLRRLCEFLQIDYCEELLQPTRHGKPWRGNSVYSEGFKGLSKEPVGRYQKILDPKRRFFIEHLLSKELISLGYFDSDSMPAFESENYPMPWLDYWVTFLKYQRWYFFKQYYIAFRYNFSRLH